MNPPAPPPVSADERHSRPIERMDFKDHLDMCNNGSRYKITAEELAEGYRQVQLRKASERR
jgi:hypothetical protein